ncbi:MAG: hypothetical protein ACOYMP_06230 [Nodosilinea sp.]
MVQRFRKSPPAQSAAVFSAVNQSGLAARVLRSSRLTYRPFLLVGLFWFLLVAIAALAYHQLMAAPPSVGSPASPAQPTLMADSALQDRAPAPAFPPINPTDPGLDPPTSSPPPESGNPSSQVSPWWLLCFIGLCALGCFGISQQAQRPRRRRFRPRASGPKPRPPAPKPIPPYSPQRDSILIPPSAGPGTKTLPPGLQDAPLPSNSPPRSAQTDPISVNTSAAVVPASEDLPLDWPEASIAHSLDLRQRRSLSSLI